VTIVFGLNFFFFFFLCACFRVCYELSFKNVKKIEVVILEDINSIEDIILKS